MIGSDDDDSDLAPSVGSREWRKERRQRKAKMQQEHDKVDRWFWRLFYLILFLIGVSIVATIVIAALGIAHFPEIIDFLEGFQ